MQCFRPITLKSGRLVPCGKCPACLANRQRDWEFRLEYEKNTCSYFFWLTLTYRNEDLIFVDGRPAVHKPHVRDFFERLRKNYPDLKFKHFLVSEYGPNPQASDYCRPHYHCVLFVYDNGTFEQKRKNKLDLEATLPDIWRHGFVDNVPFHSRVFSYVTKYCCKPELIGLDVPVKVFTRISHGIGKGLLDQIDAESMRASDDYRVRYNGQKFSLPRYYKDKIRGRWTITDLRLALDAAAQLPTPEEQIAAEQVALEKYRQDVRDRDARLSSLDYDNYLRVRTYDAVHGSGSYSRDRQSEHNHYQQNFTNKLKKRQNV